MDRDSEFLKYLDGMRSRFDRYHNHKEAMAWAAIAFYTGTCLVIAANYKPTEALERALASAVVVVLGLLILYWVSIQNGLRQLGFEIGAACDRLAAQIVGSEKQLEAADCLPPNPSEPELCSIENAFRFPRALLREIAFVRLAQKDLRRHLLGAGYAVMVVSGVAAVLATWLRQYDACP